MSAASHTKKKNAHTYKHTQKAQYLSRNAAYNAGVRYNQTPSPTLRTILPSLRKDN